MSKIRWLGVIWHAWVHMFVGVSVASCTQTQPPRLVSRYWVLFAVAYLDLGVACGRATLTLSFSVLSLSLSLLLPVLFPHSRTSLRSVTLLWGDRA